IRQSGAVRKQEIVTERRGRIAQICAEIAREQAVPGADYPVTAADILILSFRIRRRVSHAPAWIRGDWHVFQDCQRLGIEEACGHISPGNGLACRRIHNRAGPSAGLAAGGLEWAEVARFDGIRRNEAERLRRRGPDTRSLIAKEPKEPVLRIGPPAVP